MILTQSELVAQEYNGISGLLQVPSAETDSSGTFRGGGLFLDKAFTPEKFNYGGEKFNTFSYGVGLTVWRWLELSYCATLLKMHKNGVKTEKAGYYNEDRRVNVKVKPLYEGRWWPAVAIGMDDVGRFERIKSGSNGNNYFQNAYVAASKHFNIKGWSLGAHLAYRYYTHDVNSDRRGMAGGITIRPSFFTPLRLVSEWDGVGVNVGVDALLWRHLFLQAALVHGKGFTGGVSYHCRMPL
ncbi:MAG: YjbH domain-containing protein [Bacteroidaceae bacterium]|nr:YjbH domain-containing protein [Bacteroidaceae bacterium]